MGKFFSFIFGFFVGAIAVSLTILFIENETFLKNILEDAIITNSYIQTDKFNEDAITSFPGGKTKIDMEKQLKIVQCLDRKTALVKSGKYPNSIYALLIGDRGDYFQNNQIVQVTSGKRIRQVGIYKYANREGVVKIIPAIQIES